MRRKAHFFTQNKPTKLLTTIKLQGIIIEWKGGMQMKNNLKALRMANNVKQQELADAVGIDYSGVYPYEKGIRTPNTQIALKIALFFGVSVEEIWQLEENELPNNILENPIKLTPCKK